MNTSLYLHIPACKELWYRQKIMQDPDTMNYNKGYNMDFDGYDKETGCIAFPEQEWEDWYDYFIEKEPQRFYAYITRKKTTFLLERSMCIRARMRSGMKWELF